MEEKDDEHDDNHDMNNNGDNDESDRRTNTGINHQTTSIYNNNCDTMNMKNGSVHNEDETDHSDDDIDPSPTLLSLASNPRIIPPRPAKFLAIHPTDVMEIIECLRRSAEIVALSERRAGALEEEAAALAASRVKERRRRNGRKKREIDYNDASNKNDSSECCVPDKHENKDDNDQKNEALVRHNEEHPQSNHSINNDDYHIHDDEDNVDEEDVHDEARLLPHHLAPFELFCERNVLSKIVGLVTGSTFDNPAFSPTSQPLPPLRPQPQSRQYQLQSAPLPSPPPPSSPPPLLLPPLSIATQAIQSASILIQNVCRVTSLYLLLSNNVINDLIGLPLESYRRACEAEEADADEKDLATATAAMTTTGRKWGQHQQHQQQQRQQQQQRRRYRQQRHQQEISELTTHFVSFLKGLAMRVNAETLQFFLSYPVSSTTTSIPAKDGKNNERQRGGVTGQEKEVDFPLYARALEFCSPLFILPTSSSTSLSLSSSLVSGSSPRNFTVSRSREEEGNHYLDDPFVRITAMSVCMNILRLVTYHHIDHDHDSVVDHSDEDDRTSDEHDEDAENPSSKDDTDNNEAEDDERRRQEMERVGVTERSINDPCEERNHKKQKRRRHHHHQHRNTSLPSSTPTGILHKKPPVLPLQDRIAIAEYACHPTRVSVLVSPLCVRLTSQFGKVEGMVRMLEGLDKDNSDIKDDNAIDDSASTTAAVGTTTDTKSSASSTKTSSTTTPSKIHTQRRAAERTRICDTMQNLVANVQDELLLLEDLLKVGLISLNEQAIEMLLATFIYPMLLQPLLLSVHQNSSSRGEDKDEIVQQGKDKDMEDANDKTASAEKKKPSARITLQSFAPFSSMSCATATHADEDTATASTSPNPNHRQISLGTCSYNCSDLAPAKTAFYGISLVFRTISNPTFRRLLLVALLHPLSPRAIGGRPVVRSRPQITLRKGGAGGSGTTRRKKKEKTKSVSTNSRDDSLLEIRTDTNQERQSVVCGEPIQVDANLYSFGTEDNTDNNNDGDADSVITSSSNCQQVFIMAPALVDILRRSCANCVGGREEQMSSRDELAKEMQPSGAKMTRPNPYRSVLLSSMAGSAEMAALQPLAITLLHAAVLSAGSSTIQRIMFPSTITPKHNDAGNSIETESGQEALQCLCLSIVNTLVTYDGWWKVKFNTVAARTLIDVIFDKQISFVYELVGKIRHDAAKFLLAIPSLLDAKSREGEDEIINATLSSAEKRPSALVDKQYLDNWLIDRFFFDRADKSTISVVENVCYLKEFSDEEDAAEEKYRYGLEVLTTVSLTETCSLLCDGTTVVDGTVLAAESLSNTSFHCAASWALVCLYLDAFCGKLTTMLRSVDNDEAGGQQHTTPHKRLSYISPRCSRNEDDISRAEDATSYSLGHISSKFTTAMLDECESSSSTGRNNSEASYNSMPLRTPPENGSAVGLVGRAAFPCVIEVSSPASSALFTGGTCISNEGMRWQSLYLVVVGKWAVFAEPGRGGTSAAGGEGRVVASCKLACLSLRWDSSSAAYDTTNAARRLLVLHTSLDPRPPPLFVVDSPASSVLPRRGKGCDGSNLGLYGLRLTRSRMNLWFEDYKTGERARKVLSAKIAKARARRGERLSAALLTR